MPDISVIRVNELAVGTLVRVMTLAWTPKNPSNTTLSRVVEGREDPLNPDQWQRVVGLARRKFLARVHGHDADRGELILQLEDPSTTQRPTKVYYRARVPYNRIYRIARLVPQGRSFDSIEDEDKFRENHRLTRMDKAFFHPRDRFVAVSTVVLVSEEPMIINFTFQAPSTASTQTVTLPTGVFDDGNYTVTYAYNTLAGANSPVLSVPTANRTATDFQIVGAGGVNIDSGTTIDFHVQAL